ncbi:MAG: hypothetical protein K9H16_11355 [Bacteroidales bacterium]|nr:hypothetical protein [Bacteroidales bacterium]
MSVQNREIKWENIFYLLLFILIWAYIGLRAIFTQLTHDETANFFRFVQTGDFLPYGLDTSATNHLLNSFLAWVFYSLFGAEPWALRLGNVLAFPVYFYFLLKFGSLIKQPFLRISFVVVLALTHNLIEFFAMSRGYGHSMAFLLAALWFLLRAFSTASPKDYFLTLLFATLALSANLTLLNSVLIIIGFLAVRLITQKKPGFASTWKHWSILLILGVIPVLYYATFLFHLKTLGDLYYGLTTGFWEVTVKSLVLTMLDPGSFIINILVGGYFILIALAGIYLVVRNFKTEILFNGHLLFFYLLMGSIVAVVLLKIIFGVNYPEDRTGLYFVVYFFGSIFFFCDALYEKFHRKKIALIILPLLFVPLHFLSNMNLSHNSFENQKIPNRFYEKMLEDFNPGEAPPTIGGYMGRALRWGFLNYKNGGLLGKVQGNIYPDTIEDYQIADSLFPPGMAKYYDTIDFHETSQLFLLKRKSSAPESLVFEKSGISTEGEIEEKYFRFFIIDADSLGCEFVKVIFNFHLTTKAKPFIGWLVANSLDANNREIGYEYYPLEWLDKKWEGESGRLLNSMIVKIPAGIHQLNFYLWNKREVPFSVKEGSVRVMRYERNETKEGN